MAGQLRGKTVVVTGATSGIGRETALGLARRGADVVLVARDEARGEAAKREVEAAGAGRAWLFLADLASLAQVRRLAADILTRLDRIDVLINNAGALHATRKLTVDGLEMNFAVNHLAPFLLTNLLLPRLLASAPARVVTVASEAHRTGRLDFGDLQAERHFSVVNVYSRSKLCNVLFAAELARRLAGTGVTSNSLHPGLVATGFGRNERGWLSAGMKLLAPLFISARKGARNSLYLAISPDVEGVTGRYFSDFVAVRPSRAARDEVAARRLWEVSARLTGLEGAASPLARGARTAILAE
jgi:NAD(P)-dependent dehydrogenase (short-subunit alcohol dehydrogenase family)